MESISSETSPCGATPGERLLIFLARGRVFGVMALISVCLFWQSPVLLTIILGSLSGLVLLGKRSRQDLIVFMICGALGAIAEIFVVAFGAWSYSAPQFLGIPYWLPLVWGLSSLFIRRIAVRIDTPIQTAQAE